MLMNRAAVALALCIAMGFAQAGFVDKRSAAAGAAIEIAFKNVPASDLVDELVPPQYETIYANAELRKRPLSVEGKGTWEVLLGRALAPAGLRMDVRDAGETKVIYIFAPGDALVQATGPLPVASRPLAGASRPAPQIEFKTTASDTLVSAVVQRWADQANMQLVWEARDVDYPVQAENVWGNDFESSLRGLLGSIQSASRVRACVHANRPRKVVRIIKFNERCQGAFQ